MKTWKHAKVAGYLFAILLLGLAFLPLGHASNTLVACMNNRTLQRNITIQTTINGADLNISSNELINCPYGCDNSTTGVNDCKPDPTDGNTINLIIPFIMLGITAFLIWIAINMKSYEILQFFFLGIAMFIMIVTVWFAYTQAALIFSSSVSGVFVTVYQVIIVMVVIVLFFAVFSIIYNAWKNAKNRRMGIGLDEEGQK